MIMRVTIDTESKTIILDGDVKLHEFFTEINKLLPGDWREYTLKTLGKTSITTPNPFRTTWTSDHTTLNDPLNYWLR